MITLKSTVSNTKLSHNTHNLIKNNNIHKSLHGALDLTFKFYSRSIHSNTNIKITQHCIYMFYY